MLEKELQEIITLTSQELEEYREKVLELEDEVGRASSSHSWTSLTVPVQLRCREKGSWRGRTWPVAQPALCFCAPSDRLSGSLSPPPPLLRLPTRSLEHPSGVVVVRVLGLRCPQ